MRCSIQPLVSLVGALGVLGMTPVFAQHAPVTGSILADPAARISDRNISEADRARQTMNDYATCLVKIRTVAVRKALNAGSDAAVNGALAKLAIPDCLDSGMLRMPEQLLRGSIYRALYLREFAREPSVPAGVTNAAAVDPDDNPLRNFGHCVNHLDQVNTRMAVMARPATVAERQAFNALSPTLGQCVAPGNQIRFTRSVLQGALAEAAYRQATLSTPVSK